jgi:hypothetical protein
VNRFGPRGVRVMPLDRVFGQPFDVLVGRAVGRWGCSCVRKLGSWDALFFSSPLQSRALSIAPKPPVSCKGPTTSLTLPATLPSTRSIGAMTIKHELPDNSTAAPEGHAQFPSSTSSSPVEMTHEGDIPPDFHHPSRKKKERRPWDSYLARHVLPILRKDDSRHPPARHLNWRRILGRLALQSVWGLLLATCPAWALPFPGGIPPTLDAFFGSDVVGWQLPNDLRRRVLFTEEPGVVPEFATDLTSRFGQLPLVAPAGAANRYIRLTEPISGTVGDILAVRVAGGLLTLNFWSDDPLGPTANQFLANLYGAANVPAVPFVNLTETGGLQDVNTLLFPVPGSSPFTELFVASDVGDQPIPDPTRRIFGRSDFIGIQKPNQPLDATHFDEGGGAPEVAGPGTAIPIMLSTVVMNNALAAVSDKRIDLIERDGSLSDILLMDVQPLGGGMFRIAFGLWSEDPNDPGGANFLLNSGIVNPRMFVQSELGHRDLNFLLFPEDEIAAAQRPFRFSFVGSDPIIPVPHPPVLILLASGAIVLLYYGQRQREQEGGHLMRRFRWMLVMAAATPVCLYALPARAIPLPYAGQYRSPRATPRPTCCEGAPDSWSRGLPVQK